MLSLAQVAQHLVVAQLCSNLILAPCCCALSCCRSVSALQAVGCAVQLKVLPGKGHRMISSEAEMRVCMQFWAKHLKQRPADPDFVEVHS